MPAQHPRWKTLSEIRNTPVGLLTDEEITWLDPAGQEYARKVKTQMASEAVCPGHEAVGSSSLEETRRGYHRAKCKHCGIDMSYDSGD